MISKQDRVKARSVEDLERKYNFKQMGGNSSDSLISATEAREAASEAKEAASEAKEVASKAESLVGNKVGKDEYDEIVRMLNNSTESITRINFDVVLSDGTHIKFGVSDDAFNIDSSDYDAEKGTGTRLQLTPSLIRFKKNGATVTPIQFLLVNENGTRIPAINLTGKMTLRDPRYLSTPFDIGKRLVDIENRLLALESIEQE